MAGEAGAQPRHGRAHAGVEEQGRRAHRPRGRIAARSIRAAVMSELALKHWKLLVENIGKGDTAIFNPPSFPKGEVRGFGFHEAPRGVLSHWVVIKDGKIANVVVYITEIKAGKAVPAEAITLTNLKCAFVPHVAVGFKGNLFTAKNDDPVLHQFDIHAAIGGAEIFSVSLHEKGSSVTKTLRKTGLMELSCYVHPWQRAYVYIFDHPYATITDEEGKFVLKDVPPGTYAIRVWHEALGVDEIKDVKVEGTKASIIRIKYTHEVKLE